MKTNWNPSRVAFVDFETMATADLTTVRQYSEHPHTRVACAVLKVDGKDYIWRPDAPCPETFARLSEDRVLVAHNAAFDSAIWSKVAGLPEREWFDTLCTARASGLPGKLEDLGRVLQGRGKDTKGKRLIDMICKTRIRNGEPQYFVGNRAVWDQFIAYCARDVELLELVFDKTKNNVEPSIMAIDRKINERGVPVHTGLLRHLADLNRYNEQVAREHFSNITNGALATSPVQVLKWLKAQGFSLEGVNKVALLGLMQKPEEHFDGEDEECPKALAGVVDALKYRAELCRVGGSKINTALELEHDGRITDQFVYWGAHTGRWSGRALQPHNLPAGVAKIDVVELLSGPLTHERLQEFADKATEEMRKAEPTARCSVGMVINTLLRTCIRSGPMSIVDYGAVEARCVAWCAGQWNMLEVFADPRRDMYMEYAKEMYGYEVKKDDFERFVSKQIILACGYGMSGAGFKKTFERFLTVSLGKKAGRIVSEEEAHRFVDHYRRTFPRIPELWKAYERSCKEAIAGRAGEAGRCKFYCINRDLVIELPSSRKLFYRNARIEDRVPGWALLQGLAIKKPTIIFDHPHKFEGYLYGGRICENICQAICRDLLAYALVDLDSDGLRPCVHVHDEIVCESDKLNRMAEIMSIGPSWASGFPVLVEGFVAPYWTKQGKRFSGAKYINGRDVHAD